MQSLHEYMFRAASWTAFDVHQQNINGTKITPTTVYKPNYAFLVGSLVVMAVALRSTIVLFWGWWDLDRQVTLSPLETAKAFGAPIFSESQREIVSHILAAVGRRRVKYQGGELIHLPQA